MKELKADVAMYKADGDESSRHTGIRKQESESSSAQWDFNKTFLYERSLKKAQL